MPILNAHSLEFISRSAEQTRRLGMRLGGMLNPGDLVCLVGDLGAGKTTFVQGLAAGWGSLDQVSSPTFVLINVYRGPGGQHFYHVDAYRLKDSSEAGELDLDAMLENGPMVVEWAERIEDALPVNGFWIHLRWIDNDQRDLLFSARGSRYDQLLATVRRQVYGVR